MGLTDLPDVVPALQHSVDRALWSGVDDVCPVQRDSVSVLPLKWGDRDGLTKTIREVGGQFDVVLCCEVVYQHTPDIIEALLQTIDGAYGCGASLLVAYQQGRDGAGHADAPFWKGLDDRSFRLAAEVSLSPWDDVWDDK